MNERRLESLVDELHRTAADGTVQDAELLARFAQSRDPAAFELVIWRHGAMVQAVCRRVLGRSAEVDDAFQATFLVLLRKARSIRRRESLAGWLHRVALRVAERCRRSGAARLKREERAARSEAVPPNRGDDRDLGPVLHAEIDQLPERLRTSFVLCALEGKTNEEAALLLGVPHGTVLSRLSRARERLRNRLVRRGITAAAVAAATSLAVEPVSAAVVDAAVRAALNDFTHATAGPAAALAQGVIHAMVIHKLTTVAAGVLAATLVLGIGLSAGSRRGPIAQAIEPREVAQKPDKVELPPIFPEAPKSPFGPGILVNNAPIEDLAEQLRKAEPPSNQAPLDLMVPKKPLRVIHEDELRLIGAWRVSEVKTDGEHRDPEDMNILFGPFGTMLIADDPAKPPKSMTFKINPEGPVQTTIELTVNDKTQKGIYHFSNNANNTLELCLVAKGEIPSDFTATKGSGRVYFKLEQLTPIADTKWADALFVKGRTHNFGELKPGERVTHKFLVKNVYDRPISVVGISSIFAEGGDQGGGGGGPMGPAGPPMGGAGPGGFAPGAGGVVNNWAIVNSLPTRWLHPGEEATIEVTAGPLAETRGLSKLTNRVAFQVRGMPQPQLRQRMPGGGFGPPGGMMGGGPPRSEFAQSSADLVFTAEPKSR